MLLVAIFGPLLLALLLALIQHVVYQGLVRAGRIRDEDRPFFGILLFRGFLLALAVMLVVTIVLKVDNPKIEDDPFWTPEQREDLIKEKYGPDGPQAAPPPVQGEQDQTLEAIMSEGAGEQAPAGGSR